MAIQGNTVGSTMPRSDWNQTNPAKADYIKNKPVPDATLSVSGLPADAAAVGEGLASKAPNGFGLGKSQGGFKLSDLDSITAPGWYHIASSGTILNTTSDYWYLHVVSYGDGSNHCTQELYSPGARSIRLRRNRYSKNWRGWGYENPYMEVGIEYATNEFVEGDRVYSKIINFGKMPAVGGSGSPHEIDVKQMVRYEGMNVTLGSPLDCIVDGYPDGPIAYCSADKTSVRVRVNADCSAYTAHIQLWYTKN